MALSGKKRFTKENIAKTPNSKGLYQFYDKDGKAIYTGVSKGNKGKQWGPKPEHHFKYGVKHRLQSYYQKNDNKEHPTKPALRKNIHSFAYERHTNDKKMREKEKRLKQDKKHNHL